MRKYFFIIFFLCALMLPGSPVQAQGLGKQADAPVELINPIGGSEKNPRGLVDTRVIFGNAVQITLGFLGSLTLAVFIFGGYLWLTSAGNSDKVQQGTKTMMYAVMGLFIIFGAYGILTTVIEGITGKTLSGGTSNGPSGLLPANTPSENSPSDSICEGLTREQCIGIPNNACKFLNFQFPNNILDPVLECVPEATRDQRCLQEYERCLDEGISFGNNCDEACQAALRNDPEATADCVIARDLCLSI